MRGHPVQRNLSLLRGAFPSESPPARFWPLSFSGPAVLTFIQALARHHITDPMNSRRNFLKQISTAALAAGAAPSLWSLALPTPQSSPAAHSSIDIPGEDGMIVSSFRFVDLETPVEYCNTWLTPLPHFFVRTHMHEPSELSADSWRLTIGGEVEKPFTLTLSDLAKLK